MLDTPPSCCSPTSPHRIPTDGTVRDLEVGVTHYIGGTHPAPTMEPGIVTMWLPGRDGGHLPIGTLLQCGERKALLEVTEPRAVKELLEGRALRNVSVCPS